MEVQELFARNDFKADVWTLYADCATVSAVGLSSPLTFLLSIIHDEILLFCLCVNVLLMLHLTKTPLIVLELTRTTLQFSVKISFVIMSMNKCQHLTKQAE